MVLTGVTPSTYSSACNPHTYGATGDGTTDNTTMIQNAIDACFTQGGGVVELSAQFGTSGAASACPTSAPDPRTAACYLTRPLTLKSNVELQIDSGVMLKGGWSINDSTSYTPAYINWVYQPKEALISAQGANHVAIGGNGIIDGAGTAAWWSLAFSESAYPQKPPYTPPYQFSKRPFLLEFYQCDTVTISGVKVQNAPYWSQVLRFSNNITEFGVVISAPGDAHNSDGVNVVGSTNVTLSDLNIGVGDDSIALKSGLPILPADVDPRQVGLPQMATAHVRVSNVFGGLNNAGITAGEGSGISIGSEASNGVNDVTIQHVTLNATVYGFFIKSGRSRGGAIYNITVQDLVMTYVQYPLYFTDYYDWYVIYGPVEPPYDPAQSVTATTPNVHDITLQNVTATGTVNASAIVGLPEACIRNVTLSNVSVDSGLDSTTDPHKQHYGIELRHMTGAFTNVTSKPPNGLMPFTVEENVTVTASGSTPPIAPTPPAPNQVACSP
jgi:polygalacturonase